jgi:hypothetical protein
MALRAIAQHPGAYAAFSFMNHEMLTVSRWEIFRCSVDTPEADKRYATRQHLARFANGIATGGTNFTDAKLRVRPDRVIRHDSGLVTAAVFGNASA